MTLSECGKSELYSRGFEEGGLYILRSERIYCMAVCHRIGVNRIGPHKHNDWLSFELCIDGIPIMVDPGTYCYTGDTESRRMFRSTAYHNTLVVDGKEQVPIEKTIFGLKSPVGDASVINWDSSAVLDDLLAEHTGYTRLANPVVHQRRFMLDKENHHLRISDTISGDGTHALEWNFHLAQGLRALVTHDKVAVLKDNKKLLEIGIHGEGLFARTIEGWVSRQYNQRERTEIICVSNSSKSSLPVDVDFNLLPG